MTDVISALPQFIANGIVLGSIYALVAYGFSLIYNSAKIQNFAHGAVVAFAAHFMWLFFVSMKIDFWPAVLFTVILTTLLGVAIDFLVFKPLRKRKATNAVYLIASLSILVFLDSLLLIFFGPKLKSMSFERTKSVEVLGAKITQLEILIIVASLLVFALLWVFLNKTRLGKTMRAISANKELAEICGISPEKAYFASFVIASATAAVAGILIAFERNVDPLMGNFLVIAGYSGMVIGGLSSFAGALVGSMVLGLAENIGIMFLPSGFRLGIAFSLLFVFLILKPQGIFGKTSEAR